MSANSPSVKLIIAEADERLTLAEFAICESIVNQLESQSRSMVMRLAANLIATCIQSLKSSEREHYIKLVNKLIREQVTEMRMEINQ
jgi:hypothetical protein